MVTIGFNPKLRETPLKKSVILIRIEFYIPQDLKELESTIRKLSTMKKLKQYERFPNFSSLDIMVNYKGLKRAKYQDIESKLPMVIDTDNIKTTE